jgi:hypothetical protein
LDPSTPPHQATFYTSGRLSNEATFLHQLWVREFGTNNLPDCSNMCHEASGRAMTPALGTGKGRGAQLVHINPLIEAGSRRTIVPHEFADMATFHTTSVGTMKIPLHECALVVSGRLGFEIVQKAAMAGISQVVAVSAPSSLAVDLARRVGMTVTAFVRG